MFDSEIIEMENRMIDEQMEYDQAMKKHESAVMRDFEKCCDIDRLVGMLEDANEVILGLEKLIKDAKEVAFASPELNMSNYTHDEVGNLNTAMCEVYTMLDKNT
ncbi:hypothetical protein [Endozoicomonas ascidiicola]|uniref:hypothetical protein n=1 Tax=Endozoicomonas ascidiicola TaxID=1698521 RepID=UPI00083041E7|nr:hypothetical protein [Endozoicomonas ascidiicola]